MKHLLPAIFLFVTSAALAQTTTNATIPAQSLHAMTTGTATVPAQSISIAVPQQTVTLTLTAPPVTSPAPPPPPPAASAHVYENGALDWGGDWSWQASINYKDTAGAPLDGPYDIAMTAHGGGGWQPYKTAACNYPGTQNQTTTNCFDASHYSELLFSFKATQANQTLNVGFEAAGDTPDGSMLSGVEKAYCSTGGVGVWRHCSIPLSAFKLTSLLVLKFAIQDGTNAASNVIYFDDVGFN